MHVTIYPKRVARLLTYVAIVLALASFIGQFCRFVLDWGNNDIIALFNVDYEKNIPSFYASLQLLFIAFLLGAIAFAKRKLGHRYSKHWQGLSFIFFYLTIDEWFSIHETINAPLHKIVQGIFGMRWDVLNSILVPIFLLIYLKFWLRLPKQTKQLFFWSVTLYLLGAIIIEYLGLRFFPHIYLKQRFLAQIVTTIEEFLEMLGLNIFIYSLLLQASDLPIKKTHLSVEIQEETLPVAKQLKK